MSPLPPISSVPELPTESRAEILDTLFEPSTQLHTLSVSSLHETRFDSYDDLVDAVGSQMTGLLESDLSSDQRWLESILTAHPRLGEKRADTLSAHSRAEQAHLQQQQEEEGAKLAQLNRAYEDKFAGLIYVTFVNSRPRSVLMQDMTQRIARGDLVAEKRDAIRAMCDIAKDRARKLTQ